MRKDALVITIITFVLGIFGAFLRWIQNMTAFEPETGLLIRGAGISTAMIIYLLVAVAVVLIIVLFWLRRYSSEKSPEGGLAYTTALPIILSWLACGVIVIAGIIQMFSSVEAEFPLMQRIFGALAIFGGTALPFIPGKKGKQEANSQSGMASIIFVLFCCFWLVFSYKNNAENPVVWAYAVEILAVSATLFAAYKISAYFYGKASPNGTLIFLQLAAILDVTTLSDNRKIGYEAVFISAAMIMLMYNYIIIKNMKENFDE